MQKYFRAFLVGIQNAMEYRANFLLSMVSAAFPIFIQFFLWNAIYRGNTHVVINGYTYYQIIAYTVMASVIARLTRTGFEYEINDDVKNGGLNKYIVKPVDYFSYRLACFLGQKLIQTLFLLLLIGGILAFLTLRLGFDFPAYRIALFFVSLFLAFVLNYMIFFSVSMIAFWLLEIGFLFEAIRIVIIVLSGGIFPLDIFGREATWVLNCLPFKYAINFSVELLNGRLDTVGQYRGLVMQLIWIAVFTGISKILWRVGNRRYVAVGG